MLYLDELQEQLFAVRDKDVSLATLSHAIQRLAMTHKQVSKTAAERNELLRATWQAEYGDIPAKYFVWLDESSVDDTAAKPWVGGPWMCLCAQSNIYPWAALLGTPCPHV